MKVRDFNIFWQVNQVDADNKKFRKEELFSWKSVYLQCFVPH